MLNITEDEIQQYWNTNDIKVSICTISYNHEKFIEKTLDSFLMQKTSFAFNIIIDDDASTDKTQEIIKKYQKKYPSIINANLRTKNIGSLANFISNLQRAKGKYIAICEGDDYLISSNKLEKQVKEMEKYPNINMSFHPAYELHNDVKRKLLTNYSNKSQIFSTKESILGGGDFTITSSTMYRSDFLQKLPSWFYEAPIGDYYLQILASIDNGLLFVPDIYSIYRKSLSTSATSVMKQLDKRIIHVEKSLLSMDNFDKDTNYKYTKEVSQIKQMQCFGLALTYLRAKEWLKFKGIIDDLHIKYAISDKKVSFFYHWRHFPRFLYYILKLYTFIKRS